MIRTTVLTLLIYVLALTAVDIHGRTGEACDMALVGLSVANLRSRPAHSAELASQATMGTPLRLLSADGQWREVETPEGYRGWMHASSLVPLSSEAFDRWRSSDRMIVTSTYEIRCYSTPCGSTPREVVSDLVNGCIVTVASDSIRCSRLNICLPDGRKAWVATDAVDPFALWARQSYSPEKIVDMAMAMQGIPYLWGGTSTKSMDCSGLTKICHFANGIILRRDASQQARTGRRIDSCSPDSLRRGDLLFFGNAATGRVTHVALYDAGGQYVHSSQRVKVNRISRSDSHFRSIDFLHAVRIGGMVGTDGIIPVRDHEWYFLNK